MYFTKEQIKNTLVSNILDKEKTINDLKYKMGKIAYNNNSNTIQINNQRRIK